MIPLPTTFQGRSDQRDFAFKQIMREGNLAMFEKCKANYEPTYEVVIVQQRPDWKIGGRVVPAHESMPNSEQWGVKGWSFMSRESARAFFMKHAPQ